LDQPGLQYKITMKIIDTILSLLAGNIIKDIGDAFDKSLTSKEEKQQALNEAEKIYNERLKILTNMGDPDTDSWLSKNIRPILCLMGMITISVIMIFDLNVDEGLRDIYAGWTGGMITFYFGIREVIKAVKRKKNS
jgi:hypothetical protein